MCWACQVPKRVAGVSLLRVPCWERVPPLIFRLTTRGRRSPFGSIIVRGDGRVGDKGEELLDECLDAPAQLALYG